ncbi:hypothetical protein [Branchiibius hedensis]|uniref:hypothetical protein n=1 Tax=Branchiibius hedensis TaxID=672460 RepID=UPI000D6CD462|nr:hypothetical protein [Branchiibius hedensis]
MRQFHYKCDRCIEPTTPPTDRIGPYEYYWQQRTRLCRGSIVDFNFLLYFAMPGGKRRDIKQLRICTSPFHGGTVHVHPHEDGVELDDIWDTGIKATPRQIPLVYQGVVNAVATPPEILIAWKEQQWISALGPGL